MEGLRQRARGGHPVKALVIACVLIATPVWGDTNVTGFLTADSGIFPCDNVTRYYASQNLGPVKTIRVTQHNDSLSGPGSIVSRSWIQLGSEVLGIMTVSPSGQPGQTAKHFDPARSWPYGASVILEVSCAGFPGVVGRSQVYVWIDTSGI